MAHVPGWIATPWGLLVALAIILAVFALRRAVQGHDQMSTAISTVAAVIAGWSYMTADLTLDLQRAQYELELADYRGLLNFEAAHDRNWNITLQKSDREPFEIIGPVQMIPTYQVSIDEGPIDGPPVPVNPQSSFGDSGWSMEIPRAKQTICDVEKQICGDNPTLIMITLDFVFSGKRHRIVTNFAEQLRCVHQGRGNVHEVRRLSRILLLSSFGPLMSNLLRQDAA